MQAFECAVRCLQALAEVEEAWWRTEVLAVADGMARDAVHAPPSKPRTASQMDHRHGLRGMKRRRTAGVLHLPLSTVPTRPAASATGQAAAAASSSRSRRSRSTRDTAETKDTPQQTVQSVNLRGGGDPVRYSALVALLTAARQAARSGNAAVAGEGKRLLQSLDQGLDLDVGEKSGIPIMSAPDAAGMKQAVGALRRELLGGTQPSPAASPHRGSPGTPVPPTPSTPDEVTAVEVPPHVLASSTSEGRLNRAVQATLVTMPLTCVEVVAGVNPLTLPAGVRSAARRARDLTGSVLDPDTLAVVREVLADAPFASALLLVLPLLPLPWQGPVAAVMQQEEAAKTSRRQGAPSTTPLDIGRGLCDALMCLGIEEQGWQGLYNRILLASAADKWAAGTAGMPEQPQLYQQLLSVPWPAVRDLGTTLLRGMSEVLTHTRYPPPAITAAQWRKCHAKLELQAAAGQHLLQVTEEGNELHCTSGVPSPSALRSAVQGAAHTLTLRMSVLHSLAALMAPALEVGYQDNGVSATAPLDVINERRAAMLAELREQVVPRLVRACTRKGGATFGWLVRQQLLQRELEAGGGVWLGPGITPSLLRLPGGGELVYPGDVWVLLGVARYGVGAWHRVMADPVLGCVWRPAPTVHLLPTKHSVCVLGKLGEDPMPGETSLEFPMHTEAVGPAFGSLPARVHAVLWSAVAHAADAVVRASAASKSGPPVPRFLSPQDIVPHPSKPQWVPWSEAMKALSGRLAALREQWSRTVGKMASEGLDTSDLAIMEEGVMPTTANSPRYMACVARGGEAAAKLHDSLCHTCQSISEVQRCVHDQRQGLHLLHRLREAREARAAREGGPPPPSPPPGAIPADYLGP